MNELPRPDFRLQRRFASADDLIPGLHYPVTMDNIGTVDLPRVHYTMPRDASDERHFLRRAGDGYQEMVPGFDFPIGLDDPRHFLNMAKAGVNLGPGVDYMTSPRTPASQRSIPNPPWAPRAPARESRRFSIEILEQVLSVSQSSRRVYDSQREGGRVSILENPEAIVFMYMADRRLPKLTLEEAWRAVSYDPAFIVLIPRRLTNISMYIVAVTSDVSLMDAALELVAFGDEDALLKAYHDRTGDYY